jgi:hypothetical protein
LCDAEHPKRDGRNKTMGTRLEPLGLLLLVGVACEPAVISGAVPTSAAHLAVAGRPIWLSSLSVPPIGRELGIVQAHSNQTDIQKIVPEFVARVAALGGNFGKIDDITTTYEMQTTTSMQSYSCGTASAPMTCMRSVTTTVEVPTTRVLGRAFEVPQ